MIKVKNGLKKYLVDSTAILAVTTPLFATFETFVAGMSIENSINSKFMAAGLTYAGMGRLFTSSLDLSRKVFNIKQETSEKIKHLHDASYSAFYNLLICPPFYYASGVRDLDQIAIGTGIGIGRGLIAGGPMGYSVDTFRDLTGVESSKRIPKIVSRQSSKIKKSLTAIILATSIGTTAGSYYLNSIYRNDSKIHPKPEVMENISK